MNEYNGKINCGQQNYGIEVEVYGPCLYRLSREIKSKILMQSIISQDLSRGHALVHRGEIRRIFRWGVTPEEVQKEYKIQPRHAPNLSPLGEPEGAFKY